MNKGACYIRVSTNEQTEFSPDSQLKLIQKYATDHDIEILDEYIFQENGISGTKADKRPQFMKMISSAKKKPKPFDVILVYDFSRFARNRDESVLYKSILRKKHDIDIVSITQPLSDGKDRIIMESIYEAMDEYYSVNLSENSLRGKLEKASRGEHQGGCPYGYIYDKNQKLLFPHPERKDIVKLIYNEWIKPETSIRYIVQKLNNMNIKTAYNCMWSDRTLQTILRNPTYIGMTRFTLGGQKRNWNHPDTKVVQGKHEAIISKKIWELAQKKLDEHDKIWFKYQKPAPKNEHWLRGLVKCGDCGKTMVKIKSVGRSKAYFQCSGYTKAQCKISHHITEYILVDAITEQIKKDFTKKLDITIGTTHNTIVNEEINIIESQIAKIKLKRQRIKQAYINGIDDLKEYEINKKSIEKEEATLQDELKKLNNQLKLDKRKEKIYILCEEAYKVLTDPNIEESRKYDVSHKLFEKIIYDKLNNKIVITYK